MNLIWSESTRLFAEFWRLQDSRGLYYAIGHAQLDSWANDPDVAHPKAKTDPMNLI